MTEEQKEKPYIPMPDKLSNGEFTQTAKNQIVYAWKGNDGDFVTGTLYTNDEISGKSIKELQDEIRKYNNREKVTILRINNTIYANAHEDCIIS